MMAIKTCPKCGSNIIDKNEDGDYQCICGNIIYCRKPLELKSEDKSDTIKGTVGRSAKYGRETYKGQPIKYERKDQK